VPREQIAFIHEANTEARKKELFAKVRSGQVRVLMGSTFKMGAGMNVQDRLVALHDLDAPWRPGDLEQRSGRIIRQGNMNPEVHIEDYFCEFEEAFRESKEMAERYGEDTKFEPHEDADDYESKRKHRNEFTYICPYCFRELDDCRCATYPYHLVQIDKLILPVIRTLNQKGYITTACCSGHLEESHCVSIYIAFKEEYDFGSNIPAGAAYGKTGRTLSYNGLDKMNVEERAKFQKECIEKMTAWADALPKI